MKAHRIVFASMLVAACGTTMPPRELLDARAAYEKAKASEATQLKPESLHEAKVALDQAELAYQDDATSDRTRDLSYVAERKAELAVTLAGQAAAQAQKDQASKEVMTNLQLAKGELTTTRQQLETEHKARLDAEKRAREAMDKLSVAAALAVKEESRGTVITLPGSVLFGSGKWDLLPGAQEKLDHVAEALKNQADHRMIVEGHTDSQGNESSNMDLSQKRAQSVRDYLVSKGVPKDIISATGLGQSRPVADNKTAEGRANNRRVEIIVQPVEKR
jgi:outer membrane protein OmpA-like peptidoglycan-associated protein